MSTIEQDLEQEERTERRVFHLVVGADGQLVLPADVCEAMGLEPGGTVEVERAWVGAWVVPVVTDEEMAAYWGPNWREDLDQSKADDEAGGTTFYGSGEEFLAALESMCDADIQR